MRVHSLRRMLTLAILAGMHLSHSVSAGIVTDAAALLPPTRVATFNEYAGMLVFITPNNPRQVGASAGENIIASSDSLTTFVGQPEPFQLGTNGVWNAVTMGPYVGGVAGIFELTFTFNNGPVSGVGAFMNYSPGSGPPPAITALSSIGTVLESYDLEAVAPIVTPGATNGGMFRGIVRWTADIGGFRVSNSFLVLDDLRFTRAVSEPATLLLISTGLVFLYKVNPHRRSLRS
jgi:hypothetical protein